MGLAEEIRAAGREEGFVEGLEQGIIEGLAESIAEGIAEGITEGRETALIEVAKNLLSAGYSIDDTSRFAMLPKGKVLALQAEMSGS